MFSKPPREFMSIVRFIFAALAVALIVTGCAAPAPAAYPKSERTSIYVSADTVSTLTETAAQEYLIPNSQVFITGRGSDANKYFGLLGVAISRSQNESAAGAATESLKLNFSSGMVQALNGRIAARGNTQTFSVIESAQSAQLRVLPAARFVIGEDNTARLSFRFTVRFKDANTNSEVKKEYVYAHAGYKTMAGPESWSAENATAVRKASEEAMGQFSDVLLDDLTNTFTGAFDTDKQRFINYNLIGINGKPVKALLLKEYPDHLVVSPLFRDQPLRNAVAILERRAIVLQPN
jgi:hypothetical protein